MSNDKYIINGRVYFDKEEFMAVLRSRKDNFASVNVEDFVSVNVEIGGKHLGWSGPPEWIEPKVLKFINNQ